MNKHNCHCHSFSLCFIILSVFSLQIFLINHLNILIDHQTKNKLIDSSTLNLFGNKKNISINILHIENLDWEHRNILGNKIFYKIENNPKYFKENEKYHHLDQQYGNSDIELTEDEIHNTLQYLFIEFKKYISNSNITHNINISKTIINNNMLYWLEYGSLLGSWRDNDIIAWDDDGDIGIFDYILDQLPIKYESKQWIFKRNPQIRGYIYDSHNTVSARFISKINGVFIDLFSYWILQYNDKEYVYNTWSINNFDFWQILDDLLPITNHTFFNHSFNVPYNTKKWLENEYPYGLEAPKVYNDSDWGYYFDEWYNEQSHSHSHSHKPYDQSASDESRYYNNGLEPPI
eukprot:525930_1